MSTQGDLSRHWSASGMHVIVLSRPTERDIREAEELFAKIVAQMRDDNKHVPMTPK